MTDVAKLKKKAAEFELKKQFDKALTVYVEILNSYERKSDLEEVDLSLYNRVGDLFLKQGSVAEALDYYEKAVDRYTQGGYFNNAIALCNKILRSSPGRASMYYKLGKISAHKGFKGDAKANFLEYADRMQKEGKIDESFRALKEFADLCPDQDDIRLMLAEQLTKKGRGVEAIEQLQKLYERYLHDGRTAEADATIQRMKAIDPASEPRAAGGAPNRRASGDLVFLDLNDSSAPLPRIKPVRIPTPASVGSPGVVPGRPAPALEEGQAPPASPVQPQAEPLAIDLPIYEPDVTDGMTRETDFGQGDADNTMGLLEGLETTSFDAPVESSSSELAELEPTSFNGLAADVPSPRSQDTLEGNLLDFEMPARRVAGPREVAPREVMRVQPPASVSARPSLRDLPLLEDEPTIGGDLELIMPDDEVADREVADLRRRTRPAPLDDLPLLDLDLPAAGEAMVGMTGSLWEGAQPSTAADIEMIDMSLPVVEPPSRVASAPLDEISPAELGLRAGLELDRAPMARGADPASPPVLREAGLGDLSFGVGGPQDAEGDMKDVSSPRPQSSTMVALQSVDALQAAVDASPDDHALHRRLGEAMLESGDREGGLRELESAMVGYERSEDLGSAASLADEIVLLNPSSVRHHQKRVEYAFRSNERGRLIEAYLQLADALFRAEQLEKSRAIYQRVLDLSPNDLRANAALQSFPEAEPEPATPPPPMAKGRLTAPVPRPTAPAPKAPPKAPPKASTKASPAASPAASLAASLKSSNEFINLGDWLRDDEAPKDTRMVVAEEEPTGDEEADFQDMLRKFKQGIAENVEEEDHQSHYDLGVAFKEMGLLDDAIGEFQKALRAPVNRVPTYEALGQCFIEKEHYPMAATILQRALTEKGVTDDQLVGVLYLLGVCSEQRGQMEKALDYYQRVFVVDIQFRDVGDRMAAVEGVS